MLKQTTFRGTAPIYPSSVSTLVLISLLPVLHALGATPARLVVDLSAATGPISHGATGWLYGQSAEGIPTENVMAPLKPRVGAQKPIGGLQHPGGDDLLLEPAFRRAGGKMMQIYMQDIYPDWPYNDVGIEDYLRKVEGIARRVVADPNRDQFVYVPFNEPNNNWYAYSGPLLEKFLADWKTVYQKIRSLDPRAKIAGPGYEDYKNATYKAFLIFARDNGVLPDQLTWHELHDTFFPEWYRKYDDYRALERELGIGPLAISINEYARPYGDLGEPGQLVQWIARFENSKVTACLAFWTPSGSLSDLVARTWPNKATGAWWVYRWYGGMTGETVALTPPDRNAEGLDGVAAVDRSKKQLRVIFGGAAGPVGVAVKGLDTAPFSGTQVHATVWRVDSSGIEPSSGPVFEQEGDYAAAAGQVEVTIPAARRQSAYYLILTPSKRSTTANVAARHEAEYADLSGTATVAYGDGANYSGTYFVEGYGPAGAAGTEFVVPASNDGYYDVKLRYAAPRRTGGSGPARWGVGLHLNGSPLEELDLPATPDANTWADRTARIFLTGGINRISFHALAGGGSDGLRIDYIDVTPASGQIANYEAESARNGLGGEAKIVEDGAAWGDELVTSLGGGAGNFLQFNAVMAPAAGTYRMVVSYSNNEKGHAGQVERYAEIGVNGEPAKKIYFRNTFDWSVFRTTVVDIDLKAGANTIRFSNASAFAPNIDRISIAAPVSGGQ